MPCTTTSTAEDLLDSIGELVITTFTAVCGRLARWCYRAASRGSFFVAVAGFKFFGPRSRHVESGIGLSHGSVR